VPTTHRPSKPATTTSSAAPSWPRSTAATWTTSPRSPGKWSARWHGPTRPTSTLALDAAHAAKVAWGKTSAAHRRNILLKIADRIEANLDLIATAETWDNGKPIRETINADIPLSVDHFRYFAGVLRGQEGTMSEIDHDTVAYHFHEPLGVVGQIIPWNFSILMAAWKLAPALAAGNCIVMKPAEQTPAAIMVLMELIADLLPAGVLNIVNGTGRRGGRCAGALGPHRQDRLHRIDRHGRKIAEAAWPA
jgi:aldehyde dehydrogenase